MAKSVRAHPLIRDRLNDQKTALEKEFGLKATQEEIVAALIHGVTLPQLAGMLTAFVRYAAEQAEAQKTGEDATEP